MKKLAAISALFLIFILMVTYLFACGNIEDKPIIKDGFSIQEKELYLEFEDESVEYPLPGIMEKNPGSISNLIWEIVSGQDIANVKIGEHCFTVNPVAGDILFKPIINGKDRGLRFKVHLNVTLGTYRFLSSTQAGDVDYLQSKGIAKTRVFGLYDLTFDKSKKVLSKDAFTVLTPGFTGDVEFEVLSSDKNVADVFTNKRRVTVDFLNAGTTVITVKSKTEDINGAYPEYSYTYNIVDGINCFDYEDVFAAGQGNLAAADNLQPLTNPSNYNVVIRKNIYTKGNATQFWGNVYGNGYTLDATAYARLTTIVNDPNDSSENRSVSKTDDDAAFYMCSSNTTMDNIILSGDNRQKISLNQYSQLGGSDGSISVLSTRRSLNRDRSNDITPTNVTIKNSIIEKGYRLITHGGNNAELTIDTCVFRYAGHHGMQFGDYKRGSNITTFVTVNNIIMYSIRMPAIGMAGAGVELLSTPACNGTKLTITGNSNFFFTWIKRSQLDYGALPVVGDVAPLIKAELDKPENAELLSQIQYDDASGDPWVNLVIFGNLNDNNIVDIDNSNLKGTLSETGGYNAKKQSGYHVRYNNVLLGGNVALSMWFSYNQKNAPKGVTAIFPPDQTNSLKKISIIINEKLLN